MNINEVSLGAVITFLNTFRTINQNKKLIALQIQEKKTCMLRQYNLLTSRKKINMFIFLIFLALKS